MSALLINNFSTRHIFVWNNRYSSIAAQYVDSGSGSTLTAGQVMGRINSSGNWIPCISTATDGSQVPRGILVGSYTVAASATQPIELCIQGDVDLNALIFNGSPVDTITSKITQDSGAVYMGTMGDALNAIGILPIVSNEMTYQDNQ